MPAGFLTKLGFRAVPAAARWWGTVALAGADISAAALGAVQYVAKSNLVTLGYTIIYAVGNIVLTIWGAVIVAIFATQTAI